MKKQILFIWWWEALENLYDKKFIENKMKFYSEEFNFDPFQEREYNWKDNLALEIENDFDFIKMYRPLSDSAIYDLWKLSFEKTINYLNDDFILIWHSLWAIFILKYLSENKFNYNKIKNIYLISTPFKNSDDEKLGTFSIDDSLFKNIEHIENKLIFFHSRDDNIVSIEDFYEYKNYFSNSSFYEFDNYGHFIFNEHFIELLDLLKKENI